MDIATHEEQHDDLPMTQCGATVDHLRITYELLHDMIMFVESRDDETAPAQIEPPIFGLAANLEDIRKRALTVRESAEILKQKLVG